MPSPARVAPSTVWRPLVAEPADVLAVCGDRIVERARRDLEKALRWEPLGRRCMIVREAPPEVSAGGIIYPSAAQRPQAAGWVISVGPFCGATVNDRFPGGWHDRPEDLLLRKVVFGAHALNVLILSEHDREYRSDFGFLTDCDIAFVERRTT